MNAATQVSLEEYLSTTYRPDCDYIDGEVVERNVGDIDHSDIQAELAYWFRSRRKELGVWVGTELRVIVSGNRVRIPDVTVVLGEKPQERFLTQTPFLVIEVLSERDTLDNIQDRVDDYVAMGIRWIWVINPRTRRGWFYRDHALVEAIDGMLRTEGPVIALPLAEVLG